MFQAQGSLAEDSASNLSSSSWIVRSPARNPLSFRTMQARVTLLDGSMFTCTVEVRWLVRVKGHGDEERVKTDGVPIKDINHNRNNNQEGESPK